HQVSKRGLEEIVETLFEVPVALGTVSNLEQEMSQALAAAHAEAVRAVQQAPVKHADETGWKKHGTKCWLWVAATAQVAAFVLHAGRGLAGLAVLLGATISGLVISDRWCAYRHLPVDRRRADGCAVWLIVGVGAGAVDVRASAGGGADEQPRRAGTAQGGAVAEEVVRLRQRGGLPVRGADPDGGADAAPARPPGVALLATVAHRPSRASARSLTTPGMNGYGLDTTAADRAGAMHYHQFL